MFAPWRSHNPGKSFIFHGNPWNSMEFHGGFSHGFLTREADNPMIESDFHWMVSNNAVWGWKAPVKASVSGVSLLQLSPFFPLSFPFSLETPDTQANITADNFLNILVPSKFEAALNQNRLRSSLFLAKRCFQK